MTSGEEETKWTLWWTTRCLLAKRPHVAWPKIESLRSASFFYFTALSPLTFGSLQVFETILTFSGLVLLQSCVVPSSSFSSEFGLTLLYPDTYLPLF